MNRLKVFLPLFVFLIGMGICRSASAEDVVYLKNGSIIHGTITEEVPGQSIKIETNDGNVFVYGVKEIKKITHSKPVAQSNNSGDSQDQAPTDENGGMMPSMKKKAPVAYKPSPA